MRSFELAKRLAGAGALGLLFAMAATAAGDDDPELPPPADRPVDFVRDVRPILARRCLECHGPEKQKGGLRLDRKADAAKGGDSGSAFEAGHSDESEMVLRAASADETERMPPKGDPLTAVEVGILRAWIDGGAPWPEGNAGDVASAARDHWAFRAPTRPEPPQVADAAWVRNPIDRFVLARLEKEGLPPSPEADKVTLIRRLSLDLIGLPPTPEEVDAFLADQAPDAYERLVDRLLASPHYGERWGRHWLDAARYADSDGFEKDKPRHISFYRDWVVDAFNRDLPYDKFIVEQVAGDLLPGAGQDQIVATGYLRNSMINEEGGVDPEQFRMESMFDRMDAIGKGILGLTIQCAQCHDHKYDPITHEDYYRLFAFLNNDDEPARVVYSADDRHKVDALRDQIRAIESPLRDETPDWSARLAAWEQATVAADRPEWTTLGGEFELISTGGQKYLPRPDGSFLAQGYAPTKHAAAFESKPLPGRGLSGLRLELMTDTNLPAYGPGRSFKGTCALTDIEVEVQGPDGQKTPVKLVAATADYEQPEADLEPNFDDKSGKKRVVGPVAFAIDGKDETAWGIDAGPGRRNRDRQAVFAFEKPLEIDGEVVVHVRLKQNHGGWNSDDLMTNNIGRLRLAVTAAPEPKADPVPTAVRSILAIAPADRTPAQADALFAYWRTTVPEWRAANDRIEALWKGHPEGATTLVLHARDEGRMTNLLGRGDFLKPVRPVTPGVPGFLHPLPEGAPPTRLTLANWLVDPKSPTTARALVNRAWQSYFGIGLVATAEDFGTQAEAPSHPELLDWLAVEFMDKGWSVKGLHRLIVGSAAYRQASRVEPDLLARDPYNRLVARGARLRVEGEVVRDVQLAASGLLNPAVGGRSVMPPAPLYLFQPPASYAPFPWIEETGPDRYRRALYTWRRRSTPYPMLAAFDVPNGETACVRRSRSNTPLQALTTLNEPMAVEAARSLARKAMAEGGSDDDGRLAYAFRRCVARTPDDAERAVLAELLDAQRARFRSGGADPKALLGDLSADGPDPADWAAFTVVARVLLNLDETITRE